MDNIYKNGKKILKKLLDLGYEAYFVGGYVRDFFLGIKAKDIDITTNALPQEIQKVFKNTKATGLKYGTVTVFIDNYSYEITTFRSDFNYINHRKPEKIIFSDNIEEDLKRRDFTINGLALDYNGHLIDLFNGKKDLNNKLIRAIGNPNIRFKEDALRILRAFRFVSKLNFDIERNTFSSIQKNINLLKEISVERILIELKKLFDNPYKKKAVQLLAKTDFGNIYPELKAGITILKKAEDNSYNYLIFFALCFYLNKKPISDYWRFSNKEKTKINRIISAVLATENEKFNNLIVYKFGKDISLLANQIQRIINPNNNQEDEIKAIFSSLAIQRTSDLKFKGKDILKITTLKNQKLIGDILENITTQVITNKLKNNYHDIKQYTLEIVGKYDE